MNWIPHSSLSRHSFWQRRSFCTRKSCAKKTDLIAQSSPDDQVILPRRTLPVSHHGIHPKCMLLLYAADPVISEVFPRRDGRRQYPTWHGAPRMYVCVNKKTPEKARKFSGVVRWGSESFHVSLSTRGLSAAILRFLKLEPSGSMAKGIYKERGMWDDHFAAP